MTGPAGDQAPDTVRTFTRARLVLSDRVVTGWLQIRAGEITGVGEGDPPAADGDIVDLGGDYLAPGLVDIHCHGAAGAVVYSGSVDDLHRVAAAHLHHGTTSMLASVATTEPEVMIAAAAVIGRAVRAGDPPNIAGLHLEGPFLCRERRGAQTESALRTPDPGLLTELLDAAGDIPIMVTIAPELPGAIDLIRGFGDRCRFAIGHTDADHQQTVHAVDAGARHVTHLFNAMPAFGHRDPGPVAAALTDDRLTFELIADGHHLAAPVLAMATAGPTSRAVLVTDASAAAGLADGRYRFADRDLEVADGAVRRVGTGRLAGSTAFLVACLRHLVQVVGVPLQQAVAMATAVPARAAGLRDRGTLRPGGRADLLLLNPDLGVRSVYSGGVLVPPA
jgi:N-acetylglucosamine-6-phosphate deacetylase